MMSVIFTDDGQDGRFITPTVRNLLTQQEKYEAAIANLCECLKVEKVYVKLASSNNRYYKPDFSGAYYQTGASTLALLSEELCRQMKKSIQIDTSPDGKYK